jgi:hypothetical protein
MEKVQDTQNQNTQKSQLCNISGKDLILRRNIGFTSLGISLLLFFYILFSKSSPFRLYPTLFIASFAFVQYYTAYCVAIGIKQVLKNPKNSLQDLKQIFNLILLSILFAGVVNIIATFILTFLWMYI